MYHVMSMNYMKCYFLKWPGICVRSRGVCNSSSFIIWNLFIGKKQNIFIKTSYATNKYLQRWHTRKFIQVAHIWCRFCQNFILWLSFICLSSFSRAQQLLYTTPIYRKVHRNFWPKLMESIETFNAARVATLKSRMSPIKIKLTLKSYFWPTTFWI